MKGTPSTCWRRRTLTNRILPTVIQAFVVVAAWELLKSLMPSAKDGEGSTETKSARSVGQNICPTPGIPYAKTLTLLDLSSITSVAEVPSHDRPKTYHLKVDIYVRDAKLGYLILYPAGTLINFGDLNVIIAKESKAGTERVKDVRIDVADRPSNAEDTRVKKDDSFSRGKENSRKVDDYYTLEKDELKTEDERVIERGNGKTSQAQDVRYRPEVDQVARSKQESNIRDGIYQNEQSSKTTDPQKTEVNIMKKSSDPFEYLNTLNQNLAKSLTDREVSRTRNIEGFGTQQFHGRPTVTSEYDNQLVAPDSGKDSLSHGVLTDENGERLYAEGFINRVEKLNTEVFGQFVSKGSKNEVRFHFLMNNPSSCQGPVDIDVLFLINSLPENNNLRQRARDTFVSDFYFPDFRVVHVFLVGKTASPVVQQRLRQEQADYQDIIQADFFEAPENATLKGLMGMRWVMQFCSAAKYIMKINEDVFVDTDKLVRGLIPAVKKISSKRAIFCYVNPESAIPRSGPNAVSEELLPGRTRMRPYCKGFAILMTNGVIPSLIAASEYVQVIYLDELYLYGILPFVAGNIEVFDVGSKRAFHNFGIETVSCYTQMLDRCPLVASVAFNERFTDLWDYVKARLQKSHQGWENEHSLWDIQSYKRRF